MDAAARLHGRPLAQLNQLTRWYVRAALLCLIGVAVIWVGLPLIDVASSSPGNVSVGDVSLPLLCGGLYYFLGAVGIKFFPSSLGSNPHVYSLKLALWSFWLVGVGIVGALGVMFVMSWSDPAAVGPIPRVGFSLSGGLFGLGCILLLLNLWKTMQERV